MPPRQTNLQVLVISPVRVLYEGEAQAVSSVNKGGKFDIIPLHSNFISLIKDLVRIKIDANEKKEFTIEQGVIRCRNNQVKVFIGL